MVVDWRGVIQAIVESIAGKIAVVVAGVLFAQLIRRWYDMLRHGKWRVVIVKGGKTLLDDAVSVAKAKQVREMPEELPVFLKGKVSPFEWLNCDLGRPPDGCKILKVDSTKRTWTVDLDQNPPAPQGRARGSDKTEGATQDGPAQAVA
jgi:hypothetical protein